MAIYFGAMNKSTIEEFISLPKPVITDENRVWIEAFLKSIVFPFAVLGTFTNAINIRVFIQQNVLSDTNTLCLFALAVTDFMSCFSLLPTMVCDILKYIPELEMQALSCGVVGVIGCELPHVMLSHVNCCITVYIAFERSLCVLIPFKVKSILRPKLVITVMATVYGLVVGSYLPFLTSITIRWKMEEDYNISVAYITITELGDKVALYLSFLYNAVIVTTANITTALATGLMLYKLNEHKKWRKMAASSANSDQIKGDNSDKTKTATVQSKRELEMLKAVTMVTVLFVVCTSMSLIPGFAYFFVPGMSVIGINKNLEYVSHIYKFLFDSINASLNFFFYIRISTKYRLAYNEVFRKKGKPVENSK